MPLTILFLATLVLCFGCGINGDHVDTISSESSTPFPEEEITQLIPLVENQTSLRDSRSAKHYRNWGRYKNPRPPITFEDFLEGMNLANKKKVYEARKNVSDPELLGLAQKLELEYNRTNISFNEDLFDTEADYSDDDDDYETDVIESNGVHASANAQSSAYSKSVSNIYLGYSKFKDLYASTWSHEDQRAWVTDFPACGGLSQSPINIRSKYVTTQRAPSCLQWSGYRTIRTNLEVAIDEHTVDAFANWVGGIGPGSNLPPTISGGPLQGTYALFRVHFHWGYDNSDGSEHAFNSKKYPLELHFVHYNTKYATITDAINSGDPEALAVVGVLYKVGFRTNLGTRAIVDAISRALQNDQSVEAYLPLADFGVNFGDDYYTYMGSLTTPGCQQIVRWIVSRRIQPIKQHHLNVFRTITYEGKQVVDNFRDIQQLNGRKIYYYNSCT